MEYFILIVEFFIVKGVRALLWYLLFPILIGLAIYYKADDLIYNKNASSFLTNVITVIGILVGFTISTLAMLLTVNSPNIEKARSEILEKRAFSKNLTLFDSVLIGLAYITLIQGFLLIANFIYPIFISSESPTGKMMFSINIAIVVHVILILLRNILDFYFILSKK